jgi:Lon protease-like protein
VAVLLIVLALLALPQDAPRPQGARATSVPAEIPIFPLPDTVLFPDVSRPFHVFESRYRALVEDALKGNRIVGMVRLRPGFEKDYDGRPPIFEIGCAGVIEEYEQLPDGGYVILLRGLTTFRVLSEDQRKPYRIARIEARPEVLRDEDLAPLSAIRTRVERLLSTLLPFGVEPPDPGLEDAEFVNVVAQNLEMPESARQELLERNSVLARARALAELVEK